MTDTIAIHQKKYDLEINENIEEAYFKPAQINLSRFYDVVLNNFDSEEIIYMVDDHKIKRSTYHHVSGATIKIEGFDKGDISIIGTNKAIKDAWASLELLTQ